MMPLPDRENVWRYVYLLEL